MRVSAKKYDLNQRLAAVLRVVSDNCRINKVACELGLGWSIVNTWVRKYESRGAQGLEDNRGKRLAQRPSESLSCLLYTSPSPRDGATSRMPSSA